MPHHTLKKVFHTYISSLDMDEEAFKFEESKNARKGQAPKASALLEAHKLLRTLAPYFVNGVPKKTLLEAVLTEIDQKHQLNTTEVPQSIWVLYVVGRIRILMNQLRLCHQQECKQIALMNQVVEDRPKEADSRAVGLGSSRRCCCCDS